MLLPNPCSHRRGRVMTDTLGAVLRRDFFAGTTPVESRPTPRCRNCGQPSATDHVCPGHLPATTLAAAVLAWSLAAPP